MKDFVNHIDYAVKLIGIDHVGISSDFDGGGGIDGWNSAAETFNVTLELVPVPPQRPSSPDGELDVGNGNGGALIAFYPDPSTARRLEPSIVQRTKNLGAQVERHGAVTIVWVGAAASVRRAVRTCVSP